MRPLALHLLSLVLALPVASCGGSDASTAGSADAAQVAGARNAQAASPVPDSGNAQPASAPANSGAMAPASPAAMSQSGTLAPAVASPTAAPGSMTVTTKAVELRVEGVTTAPAIGGRQARPGYEFVIVDTSWKNLIPLKAVDKKARNPQGVGGLGGFGNNRRPSSDPADLTMEPTKYVVPMLKKQIWLMSDDRFADTVDTEAQNATPNHLPAQGFSIAALNDTLRGALVFEAPAGPHYRALQFYDNTYGHALIPLGGTKPSAVPPTIGGARQNQVLQLAVTEAGFSQTGTPPAGQRYYTVGLRGMSRSAEDIVDLQFGEFVFLQNDQGCVSQPVRKPEGLSRPFGDVASFPPTSPNEGQVMFLVPEDTTQARVLIAPRIGGSITLPTGADFTPSWPTPQTTIEDGAIMKVHILPTPQTPALLPAPKDGREYVLLDVAVENVAPNQGIDFQGTMQLRLVDPAGTFIQPSSSLSNKLACRLGDTGTIPAGGTRRFMYVYDVPTGMPRKLQYRGFEKSEVIVDIK